MATTYYEVVQVGEKWAMKVAGHDQAWCYPTQTEALNVAMDAARKIWETTGIRSAVRLQLPDGQWQKKRSFGGATPFPQTKTPPASIDESEAGR